MPVVRQVKVQRTGLSSERPPSSTSKAAVQSRALLEADSSRLRDQVGHQMRRASAAVLDGRVCEDGGQIAVPAGASWQLYQLNSDAYPTCDKTALAEYNAAQSSESRLPCRHGGGPGIPDRRAVGPPHSPVPALSW